LALKFFKYANPKPHPDLNSNPNIDPKPEL